MASVQERKERQLDCTWQAAKAGLVSAAGALAVSWPAVYLANQRFKGFRTRLGISGKTALVVRGLMGKIQFGIPGGGGGRMANEIYFQHT